MKKAALKKSKAKLNLDDWLILLPSYGSQSNNDEVSVAFCKTHKDRPEVNRVRVKFGRNITETLKWKIGDKLCFYVNPDDKMHFLIVKSDSQTGYALTGSDKGALYLNIKWDVHLTKFTLSEIRSFLVDYEIHEKYLSFRAVPK